MCFKHGPGFGRFCDVDTSQDIFYIGGYSQSRARDGLCNDSFSAFAVVAKTEDYEADKKEIMEARWLDWQSLLRHWQELGSPIDKKKVELNLRSLGLSDARKAVQLATLRGLTYYQNERGFKVHLSSKPQGVQTVQEAHWGTLAIKLDSYEW